MGLALGERAATNNSLGRRGIDGERRCRHRSGGWQFLPLARV